MAAALRPLRLPGFPNLALAYLVNELGNWLGEIALAILVFDATGSPLATAGLFCAMHFAPAFISPALVARCDRIHARVILPALYAAEAVIFAVLALLASDFSLVAVLVLAVADGSLAAASRALTRASASAVLAPAGALREGNALMNVAYTVGSAGGPALGGLLVATASVSTALAADAVSFLVVAVILLAARRLPQPEAEVDTGWRERLRAGLRYVRERPTLRRLLGAQAAAFVFFSLVVPIEVVFVKETLDSGDAGYGALLASWGVGMVLGSVVFAAARRISLPLLLAAATLSIAVAYLATAAAPTLLIACAAALVGGIGNGVQWIGLITAVQELTRANYQARVLSFLEALASAMPGVGFLLGGAITAIFEPRASYAVAGAGVVLVLIVATVRLRNVDWTPELEQADASRSNGASSVASAQHSRVVLTDS